MLRAISRGAHGGRLPKVMENAPVLHPWLSTYLQAFWTLDSCRTYTMGGAGPIPWTAILAYANEHGFDEDMRDDLYFHVRSLDLVYLRYVGEQTSNK